MGDKLDANDKAAVEAELNALKEAINRAPIDQMTDAQIEDIKARIWAVQGALPALRLMT